jgi:hypothetical protein
MTLSMRSVVPLGSSDETASLVHSSRLFIDNTNTFLGKPAEDLLN